jgi:hypothetical protein
MKRKMVRAGLKCGSVMFFVMLNLVTVREKNDTFLNLSSHRVYGKAAANHVCHVEILFAAPVVMKL